MKTIFKNKQLLYLFLCNFAILFIGFGLFPLLPLYASDFGASPSFIGLYLAITYIAISIGSILAAQLSELLPRKTLFVTAGLLGTPALFLLGRAQSLWHIVVLTALVWFAGGIGLSISNVLTGLYTTSSTRGKAFGLLALASPLGALIGGLVVGWLVSWNGYPLMFSVLAIVWSMYPVLAWTKVQYKPTCVPAGKTPQTFPPAYRTRIPYLFLLVTVLLTSMTLSVGRLGLSMTMKNQQFSPGDVSTANAFGGLITIPIMLLIGVLSDRLGRKHFLLTGYIVAMVGTLALIGAQTLWQFWIVSSLILASRSVITSMSPAYATDLLSRRALGKALPLIGTMNWVSGVIGFAGSGFVLDTFGPTSLYSAAAIAAVIASLVVAVLPASLNTKSTVPGTGNRETLQTIGD
jgi:DHA1 family multidrug resistance protein-like MFS transporter